MKDLTRVVFEILNRRLSPGRSWLTQQLPFQSVVVAPVLELVFDPMADHHALVFRIDGQIALVKKSVEIAAEQQTV